MSTPRGSSLRAARPHVACAVAVGRDWLRAHLAAFRLPLAGALRRYVDGVVCLGCEGRGVLVKVVGSPNRAASYKAAHCAACGGRGWVCSLAPIGTVTGGTGDDDGT